MKSLNQKTVQILTVVLLLIGIQTNASAGDLIKGNGTVISQKRSLEKFHRIEIETFCNVTVNNGSMPMMELKTDENIAEKLNIRVEDGVLIVSTEYWLEATVLELNLQTTFITSFKNSGWGRISIRNLQTDKFELYGKTGKISLEGKVNKLIINAGTGNIDASNMEAQSVEIDKTAHDKVKVNAKNRLVINGNTNNVFYTGKPELIKNGVSESPKGMDNLEKTQVEYVTVKIKNNSLLNMAFVIRGPEERSFSYGFSMFPFSTKKEKVPVGTQFFDETITGEKLLRTVKKDDDGKTINLFK